MKLEEIGFYTLSDYRVSQTSETSPLWRCEILVTNRCNFNCPYCRHVGPEKDMSWEECKRILDLWIDDGLKNVRFSGGEPTMWPHISKAVNYCNSNGVERVAISTNGSADRDAYERLMEEGASDFSVSFDACCAEQCSEMSGGRDIWKDLLETVKWLSSKTYVTCGVVLTEDNINDVPDIIKKAEELGVSDIRLIPAAQYSKHLAYETEADMPILKYRQKHAEEGVPVRGLRTCDSKRCALVLDDMAVIGGKHYPCIIYAREGGDAIGEVGTHMRQERKEWFLNHNCLKDEICAGNCLDVCRDYNNKYRDLHE